MMAFYSYNESTKAAPAMKLQHCHFTPYLHIKVIIFLLILTFLYFSYSAKPGRVVGPIVQCEDLQNIKGKDEARIVAKNQVLPQSTANSFFMNNNATNQEKHVTETKITSQTLGIAIDINPNPYNQTPLAKAKQVINRVVLDAKLLQTQSQLGAIGAAAVAVASQRNVGAGATQFVGMS